MEHSSFGNKELVTSQGSVFIAGWCFGCSKSQASSRPADVCRTMLPRVWGKRNLFAQRIGKGMSIHIELVTRFRRTVLCFLLLLLPCAAGAQDIGAPTDADAKNLDLYMKVQLDRAIRASHLQPGQIVEGKILQNVYEGGAEVLSAGSSVRLTVRDLEERKRSRNDHWPWLVKAFIPRHEKYPEFEEAQVRMADGRDVPLTVSLVSLGGEIEVRAQTTRKRQASKTGVTAQSMLDPSHQSGTTPTESARPRSQGTTANFRIALANDDQPPAYMSPPSVVIVPGTTARLILLDEVSASHSHAGDSVRGRLVQPVYDGSRDLLPEGTIITGKVVKATRPRMLSRAGSLLLTFTGITLPNGSNSPIAASISGINLRRGSHTRVDPEGALRGERPGKAWMLLNLGATGGLAKVADDGAQLLAEAIVSSATDVSTAGTARIVSACVSGVFMLTRHGRDVILPKFTELSVTFDRPPTATVAQLPSSRLANHETH